MGCAAAVHLLRDEPSLDVTIVEPDPGLRARRHASRVRRRPAADLLSGEQRDVPVHPAATASLHWYRSIASVKGVSARRATRVLADWGRARR
jgi:hypothetical protein